MIVSAMKMSIPTNIFTNEPIGIPAIVKPVSIPKVSIGSLAKNRSRSFLSKNPVAMPKMATEKNIRDRMNRKLRWSTPKLAISIPTSRPIAIYSIFMECLECWGEGTIISVSEI